MKIKLLILLLLQSFLAHAHAYEKEIVVIIPSYNNSKWYKQNLDSVIKQNYTNYRIIYIDDHSTDDTYGLVKNYIAQNNCQDKVTLIGNTQRKGALANLYHAIHSLPNHVIAATVDGDDWLAHANVLAELNKLYSDPNVWTTYGQYKCYPANNDAGCAPIAPEYVARNMFREYPRCPSHLRTFYAGLFKQIKLKDLLYEQDFFDVTWDMAMLYPIFEMAGSRYHFITQANYIYNCDNALNDFKVKLARQSLCVKIIKKMQKYQLLVQCPLVDKLPENPALFIFAHSAKNVAAHLTALNCYAQNVSDVYVLCTDLSDVELATLKNDFKTPHFVICNAESFKQNLLDLCAKTSGQYIALLDDRMLLQEEIDFRQCVCAMNKTLAYGFYLAPSIHAQNSPKTLEIDPEIFAWQFCYGQGAWATPHCLAAIYDKNKMLTGMGTLEFTSAAQLEDALNKIQIDMTEVGLTFGHTKMVAQ